MGLLDKFMEKTREKMLAASDEDLAKRDKSRDRKKQTQTQSQQNRTDSRKVMLVNSMYNNIGEWLNAAGYQVDDVVYIQYAMENLQPKNFYLILIDIDDLYVMEDEILEDLKAIHDMNSDIPILLVSVPDELRAATLDIGVSAVFGYNYDEDEVIEAVRTLIG